MLIVVPPLPLAIGAAVDSDELSSLDFCLGLLEGSKGIEKRIHQRMNS